MPVAFYSTRPCDRTYLGVANPRAVTYLPRSGNEVEASAALP